MKTPESITVKKLRAGDMQAFNELFAEYSGRLFGFEMRYLRSEAETEELVQNIFFKIWKNRERLDPAKSFKAYIFTIAYNEIRTFFQQKSILMELTDEGFHPSAQTTDDHVAYASALDTIKNLLATLPARQREIFELSRFGNLSSRQIAEKMGISPKTVDNQVSETIRFLRSVIGNNLGCMLLLILL